VVTLIGGAAVLGIVALGGAKASRSQRGSSNRDFDPVSPINTARAPLTSGTFESEAHAVALDDLDKELDLDMDGTMARLNDILDQAAWEKHRG
jgi:hypothetical protein